MKVLVTQSCSTLWDSMDCNPSRLLYPWNSPGKNTGVGSHSLLQGNFLTQGLNLGLPALTHIAQLVKNPPAMQETPVRFLGREDLLEKG